MIRKPKNPDFPALERFTLAELAALADALERDAHKLRQAVARCQRVGPKQFTAPGRLVRRARDCIADLHRHVLGQHLVTHRRQLEQTLREIDAEFKDIGYAAGQAVAMALYCQE